MSEVKSTVREYIEEFITYGDPVADDESLVDAGVIDSTGVMEMVLFLEETWGIEFEENDIDPEFLDTINLITATVEGKMKEAA